ncbi:MAG: DUF222 domain-containing protein, partial [Actinomycetota bacterium]|nr:DUF222 domain-containing protein [Actinomycetota bacterium]
QGTSHNTKNDTKNGRGNGERRSAMVDITVDLDTLTGLADHPGELNGFAPVIADIARQVAADQEAAEWRYTVTDTETNQPLHTGITRRRPTAQVRRTVQARDRTCVFPGCRMPATATDLDHRTTHVNGGPATEENLAPLCRYHHRHRHKGWTYQPTTGGYQWRSRLRHTYTTTRAPPWAPP